MVFGHELLKKLPFESREEAARALITAGLLDQLIFKYKLNPQDLRDAGIGLDWLLPRDEVILLRTERLNHFLRTCDRGAVNNLHIRILKQWLASWTSVISHGLRIEIDDTGDRSVLLPADVLIDLFSSSLPELASVTRAVRSKSGIAASELLYMSAERLAESRITTQTGNRPALEKANTLLLLSDYTYSENPLASVLVRPVEAPAIAAIFLISVREQNNIVSPLLEAAMQKLELGFAAAVPVPRHLHDIWFDHFLGGPVASASLAESISSLYNAHSAGATRSRESDETHDPEPLLFLQKDFTRERAVDPRERINDLLQEEFNEFLQTDRADRYAAAPDRGLPQSLLRVGAAKEELKRRHVQIKIRDALLNNEQDKLYPATDYEVDVFLDAFIRANTTVTAFPEHRLDYGAGSVRLDISFTPLYIVDDRSYSSGQIGTVTLPESGPSTAHTFRLKTPANLRQCRVRIVISHRSSALQTLILALEPISGDARMGIRYRLAVESNLERASTPARPQAQQFDLTLVLNDNFNSKPGVGVQHGNVAFFTEPEGWADFVKATQVILSKETGREELAASLNDPLLTGTLRKLAVDGATALKQLRKQSKDFDPSQTRNIQIVEAVNGAFLPVEFFYDVPAPNLTAPICPGAVTALTQGECAADCAHADRSKVICPIAFWGISKHIERRKNISGKATVEVMIPVIKPVEKLTLGTPMLAVSQAVHSPDYQSLRKVLETIFGKVYVADDWAAWITSVAANRPNLHVLLPHSGPYIDAPHQLALEIQDSWLLFGQVDSAHVTACDTNQPIVLMLGCATANPLHSGFMNFASEFYSYGARMVLATLSEVRGRHASPLLEDLFNELSEATDQDSTRDFPSVLSRMKRNMFKRGNIMGLTLISYGDAAWEITHD